MFDEVKKNLLDQWAVIETAPAIFIMAVLLLSVLIWAAMKWAYSARIENKDSVIELQNAQIGDYKQKLNGASPDEAKARIDALENRLQQLVADVAPRTLTKDQVDSVVQAAARVVGDIRISVLLDMASPDGKKLAGLLAVAYKQAGWRVATPSVMGIGNPPVSGLAVHVKNAAALTPAENAVIDGLRRANLEYDLQQAQFGPMPPPGPDVEILVTSKLR